MEPARGVFRPLTRAELVYEAMGDAFSDALSLYDTQTRVRVLIDEFLPDCAVVGKKALDVGCGLGFFSRRLVERGAHVVACDVGPHLVERTRRLAGCDGEVADALDLVRQFGPGSFDLVVSSECIEHTPDPLRAISEMLGVLRPGGHLSLSTPNLVWSPIVRLATKLGMRPFDGLEHFSTWPSVRAAIERDGATILEERGVHLFPFQLRLHRLSSWCDRRLQPLRGAMINICVLGRRHGIGTP